MLMISVKPVCKDHLFLSSKNWPYKRNDLTSGMTLHWITFTNRKFILFHQKLTLHLHPWWPDILQTGCIIVFLGSKVSLRMLFGYYKVDILRIKCCGPYKRDIYNAMKLYCHLESLTILAINYLTERTFSNRRRRRARALAVRDSTRKQAAFELMPGWLDAQIGWASHRH